MSFWKKKDNLIIAAVVFVFCVGLACWSDICSVKADRGRSGGQDIASLAFLDGNKKPLNLKKFQGKPLIINFWATWCPVCVRKMASLDAFARDFKAKGGEVITLSEDMAVETAAAFLRQNGHTHLPPYLDQGGKLMSAFGVGGLPTTVFIDQSGREVDRIVGGFDWSGPHAKAKVAQHFSIHMP